MTAFPVPALTAVALALTFAAPATGATRAVDVRTQERTEIVGAASLDAAGYSTASAGDVDGDGIDDIVVGAPQADGAGRRDAGAAYVVFGRRRARTAARATRVEVPVRSRAAGFRILGPRARAFAALGLAAAGDVNGDGRGDLVVAGDATAYVVFGKRGGATVDLAHLGSHGVRLAAPAGRRLTSLVAGGRDVNGDHRPDVVVVDRLRRQTGPATPNAPRAERDRVDVIFGGMRAGRIDLGRLGRHGYVLRGHAVAAVALAADMNGDRRAEVVAQVREGSDSPVRARVVFGRAGTAAGDLQAAGARGFAVLEHEPDRGTLSLAAGGDVDGDGRGDLVLGSWFRHDVAGALLPGAASVVFGDSAPDDVWIDAPGPRVLTLSGPAFRLGDVDTSGPTPIPRNPVARAVSIVGDMDGDGRSEVVVGGGGNVRGRTGAGRAYLVRGGARIPDLVLADLGSRGLQLDGPQAHDGFGGTTSAAGDFDGDGHADLLVGGAESTRKGRVRAGVAWLLTRLRP